MSIFPDLAEPAGVTCAGYAPKAGEFVGPGGVLTAAVVSCTYAAVPGATAYYVRWSQTGVGGPWIDGLRTKFQQVPGLDSTTWQTDGTVEGSYFAASSGRAGVLIYACYERVPECVTVQGPDADTASKLFQTWRPTRQ
jgi:hypothetical protein